MDFISSTEPVGTSLFTKFWAYIASVGGRNRVMPAHPGMKTVRSLENSAVCRPDAGLSSFLAPSTATNNKRFTVLRLDSSCSINVQSLIIGITSSATALPFSKPSCTEGDRSGSVTLSRSPKSKTRAHVQYRMVCQPQPTECQPDSGMECLFSGTIRICGRPVLRFSGSSSLRSGKADLMEPGVARVERLRCSMGSENNVR